MYRLRLLYNSGEELWKHIGKAGSGNNSFGRGLVEKMLFYAEARISRVGAVNWYDENGHYS